MARTRMDDKWKAETLEFLGEVKEVIDGLRQYWPLTLRQVYYQLVAAQKIDNNVNEYKKLSRLLSKARLNGRIAWSCIEDRARTRLGSGGWYNREEFKNAELRNFLSGFRRDLLQSQSTTLEVWVEKDALSRVVHDVAFDYCVPVVVARGYSSLSFVNDFKERVESNMHNGQNTKILYFGDLDPSGWNMLPAMLETLQDEMGLGSDVEGERFALTPTQVHQNQLPISIDAMKESDSRTPKYKNWLRNQGEDPTLAVELDALNPGLLQSIVRDAIEMNLDMDAFYHEKHQEADDEASLDDLREKVSEFVEAQ